MSDISKPYQVWSIPKRKGGVRTIESPNPTLKKEQKEVLRELSKVLKVSPFAYGFQPYKNITLMAQNHVGKKWVACIDISDFFPSITYANFVQNAKQGGVWLNEVGLDSFQACFYDFNDGKGHRLPQGAPTSPFLSNAYLFRFDWRMAWLSYSFGCDYSRYADDIVVSGDSKKHIVGILKIAEHLLTQHYNLKVNRRKTKIMHQSRRQMVCSIVVNEKLNLPRKLRKNLRAELFQLQQKGGGVPNETAGRVAFHKMVHENSKTTCSSREIIDQILVAKKLTGAT